MPGPVDWRMRLWYRVTPNNTNGCWEWQGRRNARGYGALLRHGKLHPAHRLSYELFYGDIPEGRYVCHHCDNPCCVNPAHLYAGTPLDNVRDRRERNRFVCNKRKKIKETGKCLSGRHDWTPENIRRTKQGRNLCLACNREIKRKHHQIEYEKARQAKRSPVLDG